MRPSSYDCCGWATKNDILCSDGRTIRRDAFKHDDGAKVPLLWNHNHTGTDSVLGKAILENRDRGVYAYCSFNNTAAGRDAAEIVKHGDVTAFSIYANKIKQQGNDVVHGSIKEVSLVLAGANPGAYIETVLEHSDFVDEEAIIAFIGDDSITIEHSDNTTTDNKEDDEVANENTSNTGGEETVQDVFDTLNEKQKTVVYALIGQALEDAGVSSEGGSNVKHNVFDNDDYEGEDILTHAEIDAIFSDAKRTGSLKDSVMVHADDAEITYSPNTATYGIDGIDFLFPEARNLNNPPDFIKRRDEWVSKVMNNVHKSPFSRIKSTFADITKDEARAKGYTKGKKKMEEVFTLLKRSTTPTTIYKKQKLDRDDVIDITDFDVVAYIKGEMRGMLDEEIARAILIGDGRNSMSDDKISEEHIRPIWTDDELFTIKKTVDISSLTTDDAKAKAYIRAIIKSRKDYRGSGNPVFFTTEDVLTDMLLLEDANGRVIYDSQTKLETALRVSSIVTVPVMEDATRTDADDSKEHSLIGLIVNLKDYNVGADKGGAVSMFDDFDIDFNQMKYLIETRCSGALIKPFSAIAIETISA